MARYLTADYFGEHGIDKGKYAWAKAKLTEASLEHLQEFKQDNASQLRRLKAFERGSLSGRDLANYDTVAYQMETIARTAPFDYGDVRGYVVPYVVSQLTGAYQSVPSFLDRRAPDRHPGRRRGVPGTAARLCGGARPGDRAGAARRGPEGRAAGLS